MAERETWGADGGFTYEGVAVRTGIKINGTVLAIEPGASFRDTVKNVTLEAGLGKYRVFLNGAEIRPSEAPAQFAEGDVAEVRAYDVAGGRA